jgi:hypothetical protein
MEKPGAIVSLFATGHVNIQRGGSGNFGVGLFRAWFPTALLSPWGGSAASRRSPVSPAS